ncbi:MAG TPA: MmgE/PrpD family protein [Galbitalea sp.]|jgi:2-methylcitrate dehydratase PrpD|nr:MmgE/PrpD family protein [Galbitalea sp.]
MPSATERTRLIEDFILDITVADIPSQVRERATDSLTDLVGVYLAGLAEPVSQHVFEYLKESGQIRSDRGCALIGLGQRASLSGAALFHGTTAHALDYDDTAHPAYTHPSSHIFPTLFSLATLTEASGEDLLTAYIVGMEVEGKLGACIRPGDRNLAMHPTAIMGPIGATAAGARLLGLSRHQLSMALGIAGSSAGGLRANFGTMTKPLHSGRAAEGAVAAVLLARDGLTAAENILETRFGYFDAFRRTSQNDLERDLEQIGQLGVTWELLLDYGIALKPFPSCGASHPAITAALRVRERAAGGTIASMHVGTNELASTALIHSNPTTPLQAKFSMQYCVASAMVDGQVRLGTFDEGMISRPEVRDLMSRMVVEIAPDLADDAEHAARVTATMSDGSVIEEFVPFAEGKPVSWFSKQTLESKFDDCASRVLAPEQASTLFSWLQDVSHRADLGELASLANLG